MRTNQAETQTSRGCVLLIEDEAQVREALERLLELEDYDVVTAANGNEALERVSEQGVDLAVLDVSLADSRGWKTAQQLTARNPYLPVIAITARSVQTPPADTAGVRVVMEKPLDLPLLLSTVAQLLTRGVSRNTVAVQRHEALA